MGIRPAMTPIPIDIFRRLEKLGFTHEERTHRITGEPFDLFACEKRPFFSLSWWPEHGQWQCLRIKADGTPAMNIPTAENLRLALDIMERMEAEDGKN